MTITSQLKKSAGGYVAEGPERWKRAQLNADRNPKSAGAKKYRARVQMAHDVACAAPSQPFTLVVASSNRYGGTEFTVGKRWHYCSPYCTTLGLQLRVRDEWSEHDYVEILKSAEAGAPQFLRNGELTWDRTHVTTFSATRPQRCGVCAKTIVPQAMRDKATVAGIETATKNTDQYVLLNGTFLRVAALPVVDLTAHDLQLLSSYGTPETRARYVADHGHPFG